PPRPTLFPYTTLFRSAPAVVAAVVDELEILGAPQGVEGRVRAPRRQGRPGVARGHVDLAEDRRVEQGHGREGPAVVAAPGDVARSEEHTSELQSLAYL